MTRAGAALAALLMVGTLVVGWVHVHTVSALEAVTFYSSPGPTASGASAYLNCGWHNVCLPPTDVNGVGLDWANSAGAGVHFQGWGYRDLGGGTTLRIGTVYVGQRNGSCKNTVADIVDTFGNYIGRVNYTHSDLAVGEGSSSYIYAKNIGYFNQRTGIATTAYTDLLNCPTTGAHLHQASSDGSWTKYGSYPGEGGTGWYDITSVGNAMYYASWSS